MGEESVGSQRSYSPPHRAEIIRRIEICLDEALRKVESGRVYDESKERVRIKWIKSVGYLADIYRKLMKDQELEELEGRLELLEKMNEVNSK